ncbi:hypothetical protein ACFUJ0_14205 [Streptomyces sp. NPDC057242]|uniref:hypothetical protein n=1 Tax=unclassified Streptomyces TaxID=2593676 RepID=UPI0036270A82
MTTRPAPHRPLLLTGLLLALAGALLLLTRQQDPPTTMVPPAPPALSAPAGERTAGEPPVPASSPAAQPSVRTDASRQAPPAPRTPTPKPSPDLESVPSGIPVSGDGPGGDYAIQRLLDRTTPADLPPALERRLTTLATRVWVAETTGTGRETWPGYFTGMELRSSYRDVRVQAAIARRAGGRDDQVLARLVWAGAGALGTFQDGRPAQVRLELHHNGWEPVR